MRKIRGIPVKGSIPPANRRRSPSSMRAATLSGLIFVGPAMGSARRQPDGETEYKPNVIKPNPDAQKARQAIRSVLADNRDYWRKEVAQLIQEFGQSVLTPGLVALAGEEFEKIRG